jgi:PAS domain S-box-containing protein
MPEFFKTFLTSERFIPHGHCYLWQPELVSLHVVSDFLIALAYYSIPVMLVYFVHKRPDVPFGWIFWMFGIFIVACGTTHLLEVWTLWHPIYWLSGFIKSITALASLMTAVLLVRLIPKALALPSPAQLQVTNQALISEVAQRKQAEEALQQANEQLEIRVTQRTAELALINESLQAEIESRKRQEEALKTSEQRFRAIFNQAAVGIAQVGIDGQWLVVNQKLCDIVGYTREELLNQTFQDITHPDDLSVGLEYRKRALSDDIQTYSLEKRYICKGASPVWINLTASAIHNGSGKPEYFIAIIEDISDRKRTEAELQKSLKDLSDIKFALDKAAIVAMTDAKGIITYVNDKFCELSQYSTEELIGKTHNIINSGYHPQEFFKDLWSTISRGKIWHGEIKNRAKDGTYYWVDTVIVPFLNDQGKPFQYLAIRFDISERKRAEEALWETNQTLQALIQAAPVSIDIVDPEGNVKLWNPAAEKMFGWSEQEVLGHRLPMIPLESWDDFQRFLHISLQERKVCTGLEGQRLKKDGSMIDVSLYTAPLHDAKGNIIGHMGIITDITERKRAEEELQKSYNLLQAVIESTPDAILVKDLQGRYLMINSAVASIQGKPKSAILGRDDSELFGPELGLPLMETDHRIMVRGETEIVEEDLLIGGSLRTYLATKSVWQDAPGNVIGLIVIARDITERKRTEREIRELNQNLECRVIERTAELEAANKELEAFSYSVSHDLRAPLRGIDGFSQTLLERYVDKLDEKGKHYLQRIRAGTQRMGELIDDLLMLSRVTRSEMHRTKVDLSALAKEIAAELRETQPERQVEFAIAPGLVVNGDARLLRVMLENLLNNAWKFTSNRIQTCIEFNVILQVDARVAYFVRDNGAGFNMAYANKLFGAFQRLHSTTQFPGTGIGLATVQRIIHRHGGRVWAEGAVEQGATFYFTL